ncbi:triacylglycerol lipase 2 [Manihot esculenta]|uniref:triacylglycerol lipase 2 n=1 Tax=Manihot esculenta TaxID=3983 RepID=UPI000B5D6202|nr:triacylglycerol lipase 2 [Manihot esculenta]
MANTLTTPILVVILLSLSGITAAARTKLHLITRQDVSLLSPNNTDSLCNSMVETQGYICQEHKVTSEDGYILSLQRMPAGRSGKLADNPPVLLQHGLSSDGATWLSNSPDESLAFILADNGYDVWIANTRGSRFSRGHTSLTPYDPAYWDWTWDELAAHDLPAMFQYVHQQTGQKLHYVGHSQGTLTALAVLSQEKLPNMLRSAALLSPIAYLNQITSLLSKAAADAFLVEEIYWLGLREFDPQGQATSKLLEYICSEPGVDCTNLWTAVTGANCCLNSSNILDNLSQPTATKNMIHLSQMIRTGNIAMYDYGNEEDNMEHYNESTPPVYNMESIPKDFPLFLSYGVKDSLSDPADVGVLLQNLKDHDADKLTVLSVEDYAHLDFVFGVNANNVVYHPVMAFFNRN